jgi:hypothetical protein
MCARNTHDRSCAAASVTISGKQRFTAHGKNLRITEIAYINRACPELVEWVLIAPFGD